MPLTGDGRVVTGTGAKGGTYNVLFRLASNARSRPLTFAKQPGKAAGIRLAVALRPCPTW